MIELIYGEDTPAVEDATAKLVENAGPEDLRDVNCVTLQAERLTPDAVSAAAFTVPFMADSRVVVVKGLLSTFERRRPGRGGASGGTGGRAGGGGRDPLGAWSGFIEQLPSLPPTTHLAFADDGLSGNNPMLRKLKPLAEIREFALPRDRDMPGWIANRAQTIGVAIERNACSTLADAVGRQPMLIDSELRKLSLYCDGRRIGVEDVQTMVAYVREANIFQAVDAVIDGRTAIALRLVGRIMDDGGSASYVMAMLTRQTRLLLLASDLLARRQPQEEIGRRIRVYGWALNKTVQQARRTSPDRLRYMHGQLVETDLLLKTKPIDERLALEMLVADLTGAGM